VARGLRRTPPPPGAPGWLALGAIGAGLAMGVKYTAVLLVFAPLLLWVAAGAAGRGLGVKRALGRTLLFAVAALVLFSPWLARNAANTGNPVYPLLYSTLDGEPWSAEQNARWTQAHARPALAAGQSLLGRMAAELREVLLVLPPLGPKELALETHRKGSLLLVLFVPFCLLRRRTRRLALCLAAHWMLLYGLYFFFTQHNERFLAVGTPVLAALSALGAAALLRRRVLKPLWGLIVLLLLFAPSRTLTYAQATLTMPVALGTQAPGEFLRQKSFGHYADMQALNEETARLPEARVLFLGEARTFYCRADCVAPTVFNRHPLAAIVRDASEAATVGARLRTAGYTHLYVNTGELNRLQTTYRHRFGGRERLGMLDGFDWERFGAWLKGPSVERRLLRVYAPDGHPLDLCDWERLVGRAVPGHYTAVYRLRPPAANDDVRQDVSDDAAPPAAK
jgi:hypothetical protein